MTFIRPCSKIRKGKTCYRNYCFTPNETCIFFYLLFYPQTFLSHIQILVLIILNTEYLHKRLIRKRRHMHVFLLFNHNVTVDFVTCLLGFQRFKSIPRCRALPKVVVNFHNRENLQLCSESFHSETFLTPYYYNKSL